jgi:hypothetical protein
MPIDTYKLISKYPRKFLSVLFERERERERERGDDDENQMMFESHFPPEVVKIF